MHKAAKSAFDNLDNKKLPTVKALQAEYMELLSEKKKASAQYHSAKKEMQTILTAKANVDRLLQDTLSEKERKITGTTVIFTLILSSQRERSHTIYCVFGGGLGDIPQQANARCVQPCPACHYSLSKTGIKKTL